MSSSKLRRLGPVAFLIMLFAPSLVLGAAPAARPFEKTVERLPDGTVGMRYDIQAPPFQGTPAPAIPSAAGTPRIEAARGNPWVPLVSDTVWVDRVHQNAIPEVVSISGTGQHIVAGWWLNNPRASHYLTFGTGSGRIPNWTHTINSLEVIPVDNSWRDSVCVTSGSLDSLDVLRSGGTVRYDASPAPFYEERLAATCDSGNVVVSTEARDDTTRIVARNASGTLLWFNVLRRPVNGMDLSSNGQFLALTTDVGVFVLDGLTGAAKDSIYVNGGSPWPPALSWNGNLLVVGGYNPFVRVYQWNGSQYALKWQYNTGDTYVTAVDVSDDASTILAGTLIATTNPGGRLCMFGSASSTPLWTQTGWGDLISAVSLTAHGQIGAATSWGRRTSTVGDVLAIFHRAAFDSIYHVRDDQIANVGSFLAVEMSDDGQYCVASARVGHARTLGNGGSVWAIDTPGEILTDISGQPGSGAAARFALYGARPNPAGSRAILSYRVPEGGGAVELAIFDIAGRRVRTLVSGSVAGGRQEAIWDGRDASGRTVPAGIYFYRLTSGGFEETRKLVIQR